MNCLTYSRAILFVPVLVLGLWLSTGLATELFPVEEAKLLPFDYVNTTGMTDLDHPVSIGGQEYIAMEISTSGILFLYTPKWDIAVVAPLASDIDLSCLAYASENLAYYDTSEDPELLSMAKSMIADETGHDSFDPKSLIIITWNKVQRYGCPEDRKTNTFQGVFATGTLKNKTQSYAIFLYGRLEWLDENAAIGVIDGRGRPLFVFGPTQSVLENLIQAPPSGVLVAALDKYWYQESTTTQNAMGQGDTSKLAAYSAKLRKPLEVLQQSIDLYLK